MARVALFSSRTGKWCRGCLTKSKLKFVMSLSFSPASVNMTSAGSPLRFQRQESAKLTKVKTHDNYVEV